MVGPLSEVVPTRRGGWWKNELQFGPEFPQVLRSEDESHQQSSEGSHSALEAGDGSAFINRKSDHISIGLDHFPARKSTGAYHHMNLNGISTTLTPSQGLLSAHINRAKNTRFREHAGNLLYTLPRIIQSPLHRNMLLNKSMNPGYIAERQEEMIKHSWSIINEGQKALSTFLRETPTRTSRMVGRAASRNARSDASTADYPPLQDLNGTSGYSTTTANPTVLDRAFLPHSKPRLTELMKPSAPLRDHRREGFRSLAGRASERAFARTAAAAARSRTTAPPESPSEADAPLRRPSLDRSPAPHGAPRLLLPPTVPW